MDYDFHIPSYKVKPMPRLAQGQTKDWGHIYLQAQNFYGVSRGEGAVIGIIDTAGRFTDHPDLADNCLPEYDRNVTNSPDPDAHGHGTHCAGIAAASDNEQGVIGIAPAAKIVALKALNDSGGGSFTWVADQLRYFADLPDTGAIKGLKRIVSMSLGGPAGVQAPADLKRAIDYAISKGVFVIAAAGNSGYNGSQSTVGAPGNYAPVIAVASTNRPGNVRSGFSSGGPETDFAAPGGSILSTHKNGSYARLSGTSMACPQVAGVVALIVSANPEIKNQAQLLNFLAEHAEDILAGGKDPESGFGAPILTNYIDEVPGDEDPVDDDPVDDEPEQPALPRRPKAARMTVPLDHAVHGIYWRPGDERSLRLAFVRNLVVSVDTDIRFDVLTQIVRGYVQGFFAGRAVVLLPGADLHDAAIWTAAFMQFIADDDWVVERFGTTLDLRVESIDLHSNDGTFARATPAEIEARAWSLTNAPETAGASILTL